MKALMIINAVILILVVAISFSEYYQYNQIRELREEQGAVSKDLLRIKQEFAKSWQKEHAHDGHKHKTETWPRFHDATGVLLSKMQNRIVVDEDEIPGLMRAMIMSYEVEHPEHLEGLGEGDKIRLKLKETENTLTVVEVRKQ